MTKVNKGLKEMDLDGYLQLYQFIFAGIRKTFLKDDFTIFDNASDLIDVLNNLFQAEPDLKQEFMNLKTPDMA